MPAMPPQGGMPPQQQPQATPPGGQDQGAGQVAQKAVGMIQQGFQVLGKLMQAAGPQLDPQDLKLYHSALQATDLLLQSLTSPVDEAPAAKPQPGGPMPAMANAQARPMPQ